MTFKCHGFLGAFRALGKWKNSLLGQPRASCACTRHNHTLQPRRTSKQPVAFAFIKYRHAISGVGRSVHVLHASALCSCEQLRTSDQVEVLVMSSEPYFEDFQVVRDLYVPAIGLWLADYPFLKRDAFQRLSEDIYWSRQEANS